MSNPEPDGKQMPTVEELFLKAPLYTSWVIDESNFRRILIVQFTHEKIDTLCVECKRVSTFGRTAWLPDVAEHTGRGFYEPKYPRDIDDLVQNYKSTYFPIDLDAEEAEGRMRVPGRSYKEFTPLDYALSNRTFQCLFRCSRINEHDLRFFFRVSGGAIEKIGQFPSLADLTFEDTRRYVPVLGESRTREFRKAIGLAAHGVGVGSFVYLRRIFEFLLEEAAREAATVPGWDQDTFQRARIEDRIQILASYLPEFIVQNRGIYGILSKGIHSLSEDECLAHFQTVKLVVELILDERLMQIERREKVARAQRELQALRSGHGG